MKKILYIYVLGTFLPIILFIWEKNLPEDILDNLTILANDIKISNYSGLFFTVIMIFFGGIILKFNLKDKTYNYLIKVNQKSIFYITIYTFFRFFNSLFIFLNFNQLSRYQVQIIEQSLRTGLPGLLLQIINSLSPIVSTVVFSSLLSVNKVDLSSKNRKQKEYILIILLLILGLSSILFDIARNSRGNITYYGVSLITGYLITFKNNKNLFNKNVIINFLLFSFISLAFIGNTYFRSYKNLQRDITTDSQEILKDVGIIKLIHDSSIAKAVGGQIVTNKAINGELILTSSFSNHFLESIQHLDTNVQSRDDYCKRYDCLHLFQPAYKFLKIFGYSKEGGSIYTVFSRNFPFNSSSHLGSLFLIFNRNFAPLLYLLLLFVNIMFVRSKSTYFQFAAIFNILFFSILAFTDNWLVTLYPYVTIFSLNYFKFINIKILRIKN